MAKARVQETVTIQPLKMGVIRLRIIGIQPLIQNRMAEKVKQTLLVGGGKKTAAEKREIKHHPLDEFRSSIEMLPGAQADKTAVGLRVVAVKAAMCDAAIETAGATKAGTQRLLFMPGDLVSLYGTPQLRMDVVRSADINKTPDIRTRAYFPKWGAEIEIRFVTPSLSATDVMTLLANAGILIGIGDFRQQKGKGSFGAFRIISDTEDDAEWNDLIANHGKAAQLAAIQSPEYANPDTVDLMEFWDQENRRRAA
jgi:hypothetical protein